VGNSRRRMLVAYLYCNRGGVTSVVKQRLRALRAAEWEVDAIFFRDYGGAADLRAAGVGEVRIQERGFPTEAARMAAEGAYDCLVVFDAPEVIGAAKEHYAGPVLYEIHTPIRASLLKNSAETLLQSDRVVVPSGWSKAWILEEFPAVPAGKIAVMPNIVDESLFQRRGPTRAELEKTLLWVGKLSEYKNWKEGIRIGLSFLKEHREWRFFILTGGVYTPDTVGPLLRSLEDDEIADRCTWVRDLDYPEMARLYRGVAAGGGMLLSTSLRESFCLVVHEAIRCGVPVVSTDVGPIPEAIRDGVNGFLYQPGDVRTALAHLHALASEAALRQAMVETVSRDDASNPLTAFSAARLSAGYLSFLEGVVEKKEGPAETAGPASASPPSGRTALRVVFAGHDLKFAEPIMSGLRARPDTEVRVDEWKGHQLHDQRVSRELAEWADVVVAEWCLGNAVWYSHNLPAGTGLVIRLHRVELETSYPEQLGASRVSRVIAVSPHFADLVRERLPWLGQRAIYVPNAVPCALLDKPKLSGSEFRLGLLGGVPKRKRLDLALDILEGLKTRDGRYLLSVKGKLASECPWVWEDAGERGYFSEQMARINQAPWRDSVVFEPHGSDVDVWLRQIGFILSPSDDESFHLSVAEGMASGAVPIIRARAEVPGLYPVEYMYADTREAVDLIERLRTDQAPPSSRSERLKQLARERFDSPTVTRQWYDLLVAVRDEVTG